ETQFQEKCEAVFRSQLCRSREWRRQLAITSLPSPTAARSMQGYRLQVVFGSLEEGAGAIVGQEDRRAVCAEKRPEIDARSHLGCFREAARDFFRTHFPDVADFALTKMCEVVLRQ